MKPKFLLPFMLTAVTALPLADADRLGAEPAPFPTTIGIRDVSQPPSAGRDPVPYSPRPVKPRKPGTRKPAKPPRTAAAKPAAPAPAPQKPQVQAAPPLPTPEELNKRYSTANESLSPLAVAPVPGPAAAPSC